MSIENIRGIQNINAVQNATNNKIIPKSAYNDIGRANDSVDISQKGKILSIVKNTSNIRPDKIQQAVENIENGTYLTRQVAEKIAERIVDLFI